MLRFRERIEIGIADSRSKTKVSGYGLLNQVYSHQLFENEPETCFFLTLSYTPS